jgi:hypothetical protein
LHPTFGLWRPVPRYEDRPKLAERGEPESRAASDTVCFPTDPGPKLRFTLQDWRKAVGLDPHIRKDATRFRDEGAPRALHLPVLAEAERVERSRPLRIIVGFKPTKHATCEPLIGGERTTRRPCRMATPIG